MFELFSSKYHEKRSQYGRNSLYHHGFDEGRSQDFKQYISARTRDVHVACYLGRDCALIDYQNFVAYRIKEF